MELETVACTQQRVYSISCRMDWWFLHAKCIHKYSDSSHKTVVDAGGGEQNQKGVGHAGMGLGGAHAVGYYGRLS